MSTHTQTGVHSKHRVIVPVSTVHLQGFTVGVYSWWRRNVSQKCVGVCASVCVGMHAPTRASVCSGVFSTRSMTEDRHIPFSTSPQKLNSTTGPSNLWHTQTEACSCGLDGKRLARDSVNSSETITCGKVLQFQPRGMNGSAIGLDPQRICVHKDTGTHKPLECTDKYYNIITPWPYLRCRNL